MVMQRQARQKKKLGTVFLTIILTTHYMEEAEHLSDKIGIIVDGILLDEDTPKALKEKTKTNTLEDAFVKIATGGKI